MQKSQLDDAQLCVVLFLSTTDKTLLEYYVSRLLPGPNISFTDCSKIFLQLAKACQLCVVQLYLPSQKIKGRK